MRGTPNVASIAAAARMRFDRRNREAAFPESMAYQGLPIPDPTPTPDTGGGAWAPTLASVRDFLAANDGADNPHSLAAMASPPTITTTTTDLLGSYSNAKSFTNSATVETYFRIEAASPLLVATVFEKPYVANQNASTKAFVASRVSFTINADEVAFYVIGSALPYRFLVDGQYVDKTGTTAAATTGTGNNWIKLVFASKAVRTITIELQQDQAVRFVGVKGADSWSTKPAAKAVRGVVFGDSITAATGATHFGDGFVAYAGDYLGMELWPSGVGGSGYIATNGGAVYKLSERLATDLALATALGAVDVVMLAMGRNDLALDQSTLQAAVSSAIDTIRSTLPAALIFVLGPWDANAPAASGATYDSARAYIEAAASGRGGVYFLDNKQVAYTKPGADPIHPDTAGHATIGSWLTTQVRAAVAA